MIEASFRADIHLIDPEALARHVAAHRPESLDVSDNLELIELGLVSPSTPPVDAGYEFTEIRVSLVGEGRYDLQVRAKILDQSAFLAAAEAAYQAAWHEEFEPEDLGHALYEAVLGSNGAPSPVEIGFEIMDYTFAGAPVAYAAPAP